MDSGPAAAQMQQVGMVTRVQQWADWVFLLRDLGIRQSSIGWFVGHVAVDVRPELAAAINVRQFRCQTNTVTHLLSFSRPAWSITNPCEKKNVWLSKNWHKAIRQVVLYSALWLRANRKAYRNQKAMRYTKPYPVTAQLTFCNFHALYTCLPLANDINVTRSGYRSVRIQYILILCVLKNL